MHALLVLLVFLVETRAGFINCGRGKWCRDGWFNDNTCDGCGGGQYSCGCSMTDTGGDDTKRVCASCPEPFRLAGSVCSKATGEWVNIGKLGMGTSATYSYGISNTKSSSQSTTFGSSYSVSATGGLAYKGVSQTLGLTAEKSKQVTTESSEAFTTQSSTSLQISLPSEFPEGTGLQHDYIQKLSTLGGDIWQWRFKIEDRCGETLNVNSRSYVVTYAGRPCCFPGDEVGAVWYGHYCKDADGTLPDAGAHCKIGLPEHAKPTPATPAPTPRPTPKPTKAPTRSPTRSPDCAKKVASVGPSEDEALVQLPGMLIGETLFDCPEGYSGKYAVKCSDEDAELEVTADQCKVLPPSPSPTHIPTYAPTRAPTATPTAPGCYSIDISEQVKTNGRLQLNNNDEWINLKKHDVSPSSGIFCEEKQFDVIGKASYTHSGTSWIVCVAAHTMLLLAALLTGGLEFGV